MLFASAHLLLVVRSGLRAAKDNIAALHRLDEVVVRLAKPSRCLPLHWLAISLSWLGNGSIYPILLVVTLARLGSRGVVVGITAALNAAVAQVISSWLKRRVARTRPYESDRSLRSLLRVLDPHSFPSGHVATLAATVVPLAQADPFLESALIGLVLMMAWARIASAHHYPSDVLAGVLVGLCAASPASIVFPR